HLQEAADAQVEGLLVHGVLLCRGAKGSGREKRVSARQRMHSSVRTSSRSVLATAEERRGERASAAGCGLTIQGHAHRAVIASEDVGVNLRLLHFLLERRGHQDVIDSPSDVAFARVRELAPPRVVTVPLLEETERIDETRVEEVLKAFPLFLGKAFSAAVRLWIREIELRMRDVEIAAEDDRLLLLEPLAIGQERRIPVFVAQLQAAQVVFRVRRIDRHDEELGKLCGDEPPFLRAVALEL